MIKKLAVSISGLVLAALSASGMAQSELRLLNSFDNRYPGTSIVVDKYADAVKQRSAGKLTIKTNGPEVVNAFEQFEPVAKGAFDMLFTVQPYHIGTTSVSMGLYALVADPEGWRKNGIYDFLDKEYQRHGLKLLGIISSARPGVGAYQAVLKQEISKGGDLKGRKLRGNRLYQPMMENLGASVVTLQGGEVYSAMQKGVIEGVFWPVSGAVDFKWYEQAKFMMRPRFGYSYHFLLMNMARYNKLSPGEQQILGDEGRKIEISGMNELDDSMEKEVAELVKRGMRETTLDKAKFDQAYKVFTDGIWATATSSRATGEQAKQFYELAKSKGLAK
jgi:TRAP-type C4-dicarboxylate transport system substrate-binding protein